jgi:hypothetical protein
MVFPVTAILARKQRGSAILKVRVSPHTLCAD